VSHRETRTIANRLGSAMTAYRVAAIVILSAPLIDGCGRFACPWTVVDALYLDCNNSGYPKARNLFVTSVRETSDGAPDSNGPGIN
jgi:hypothetical protein